MPIIYAALAITALVSRIMIITENAYRIHDRRKHKKRIAGRKDKWNGSEN